MKLTQAFRMAFSAIGSNKMRTFLTMLGIIIGVIAITMLVSVAQGASNSVADQINSLGTNLLTANVFGDRESDITMADLTQLKEEQDSISFIAPELQTQTSVKAGNEVENVSVKGTLPEYTEIQNRAVQSGRFLVDSDIEWRNAVAVIGVETAENLFGTDNVLGNTVSIGGRKFEIVGILEEKGSSMMGSGDDLVIIPFTTAQRLFNNTHISTFYVSADSEADVTIAEKALNAFLMEKTGDADSYNIFNQSQLLDIMNEVTGTMSMMLGGIAGISLLVGGIGIMNIMLVSVSERTREIGIRKAIGAKRWDILSQFLIEAIVVSLLGGLIGLGIGYLGTQLLSTLMGMDIGLSVSVALIALGFSALIGIVFGIYPASKASKLRPIQALRYE